MYHIRRALSALLLLTCIILTACTASGGVSPSKNPFPSLPFFGGGDASDEEDMTEVMMESCEGVYVLHPITVPGDFYYPEVRYGNSLRTCQYFHTDGGDAFYVPVERVKEGGSHYIMTAFRCEDGSYIGEYPVVGDQHFQVRLDFGVLSREPVRMIGIAQQEEQDSLTFCIQDGDGTVLKTSETLKSPPDKSGYYSYLLDDDWMLVTGRSTTSFYMVSTELQIMGPYDVASVIMTGTTQEDGRVLLLAENGTGYLFDPARDTVSQHAYFSPCEAQQKASSVLTGPDGVYFIGRGGITVQRDGVETLLCDFEKSYLSAGQLSICKALAGDRFLAFFRNPITGERYPALLTPDTRTERPAKTVIRAVSVGAEAMTQSNYQYLLIQNLASQFNRTNDKYCIAVTSVTAEALEDALLRGEKYDLYLFGEAYADGGSLLEKLGDKHLFADLSGFAGKQDLLPTVKRIAADDITGEITLLPLTVRFSTLAATVQTLPKGTPFTYETLFSVYETLGDGEVLFSNYIQRDLQTLSIYDFVDRKAGESRFSSPLFLRVMQFLSDYETACFGETGSLMTAPASAFYSNAHGKLLSGTSAQLHGTVLDAFAAGNIKFLSLDVTDPDMIPVILYLIRQCGTEVTLCGYPSADGGSVRVTTDLSAAIGADTAYSDGVYAFLRLFLSDTVQTSDALPAFPVTRSAVDAEIGNGYQYFYVDTVPNPAKTYGWDSYLSVGFDRFSRFELTDLSGRDSFMVLKPEFDAVLNHFTDANPRGAGDRVIREIVAEEMSYVTQGVRSAADAAKIIDSRVWIYLNE